MAKPSLIHSTKPRRVRVTTSGARSHADAAAGPRPIVSGLSSAVTKPGPSRSRVQSPEQPTEPPTLAPERSHSQERVDRMATSPVSSAPPLFVGIDVAKDKLDLARSDTGEILTCHNTTAGIRKIVESLRSPLPTRIVLEATGGLEQPLLDALLDANLPVARVNPGKVRHLAKGLGILAKTDAIDARLLVEFARLAEPRLAQKRSEKQAELDALVTCRRQLVSPKTDQSNQLAATASPFAKKVLKSVLGAVENKSNAWTSRSPPSSIPTMT